MQGPMFPRLPREAVGVFERASMSPSVRVDLGLAPEHGWKRSRLFDGQMTRLPARAVPKDFYKEPARMVRDYAVPWDK